MAANTYGITGLSYGVPVWAGYIVNGYTNTSKCNIEAKVYNETGSLVVERYDNRQNDISLEVMVVTGSAPIPGNVITYDSIKYIATQVALNAKNQGFYTYNITAHTSDAITLP